jgi:4-nitrophenyl phosphatase
MTGIDSLILDMDGVLWHGDTPVPGLADLFAALDARGLRYVLATNNATRVASQYRDKLAGFGVSLDPERILTSAEATAGYLRRRHPDTARVFVVGEDGLHRALREGGFELVTTDAVRAGAGAEAVVVGLAREALAYETLAMAGLLLRRGAHFLATNSDPTFPSEIGLLPGAGAVVSFLETASDRRATVIGKPHPTLFEEALARLGSVAATTAMVGDRLATDIVGGHAAGLRTVLVLSGVSARSDLEASEVQPDHVFEDVHALVAALSGPSSAAPARPSG